MNTKLYPEALLDEASLLVRRHQTNNKCTQTLMYHHTTEVVCWHVHLQNWTVTLVWLGFFVGYCCQSNNVTVWSSSSFILFFPPVTIIFSVVLKKWWISAELDLNWDWRKIIRGLYCSVTISYSCKYTGKTNNLYWRALTFKPWCTADQIADLSQIKFSHGRVATLWWKQSQRLRFSNF